MDILSREILVLNKNWRIVRVSDFKRSLKKVSNNRAKFIDPETFMQFSWEEWLDTFSVPAGKEESDKVYIHSKNISVRMPEVIVCTKYAKMPSMELKLTRRNLLIRDNFQCQYTGERVTMKTSSIDHVIPRSRGGLNTWENLVICTVDANMRKRDRTPEEAGMKLLKKPERPKWNPLYILLNENKPESWKKFIETNQWNEIGYWDTTLSG